MTKRVRTSGHAIAIGHDPTPSPARKGAVAPALAPALACPLLAAVATGPSARGDPHGPSPVASCPGHGLDQTPQHVGRTQARAGVMLPSVTARGHTPAPHLRRATGVSRRIGRRAGAAGRQPPWPNVVVALAWVCHSDFAQPRLPATAAYPTNCSRAPSAPVSRSSRDPQRCSRPPACKTRISSDPTMRLKSALCGFVAGLLTWVGSSMGAGGLSSTATDRLTSGKALTSGHSFR